MALQHFLRTFNVPLFIPSPYFIHSRFVKSSAHRNKSLHKATFLSLVDACTQHASCMCATCLMHARNMLNLETAHSIATSFQVFFCPYVYKLTVWNVVHVLAWSSISHSHCGRLSPYCKLGYGSILLALFYFAVFSCHGYCCLATIVFAAWVAMSFFNSLRHNSSNHFLPCYFHRCRPFSRCSARQQLLQLFIKLIQDWTFLC